MSYMTKEYFLRDLEGWNSHLPLLWEALQATQGEVIELGIGDGSTLKLHEVCKDRKLYSYENNIDWYRKFEFLRDRNHAIEFTNNWMEPIERHRYTIGVLFSDESPGEIRKYNIAMFCNTAQVIVAHDSEAKSNVGYRYDLVKPLFKYHIQHEHESGTHTAAFSNLIDVGKWVL
jgi:hypothetical protein